MKSVSEAVAVIFTMLMLVLLTPMGWIGMAIFFFGLHWATH